eukprot:scaffold5185_cov198-Alexandrium_tamarense.AAC.36
MSLVWLVAVGVCVYQPSVYCLPVSLVFVVDVKLHDDEPRCDTVNQNTAASIEIGYTSYADRKAM